MKVPYMEYALVGVNVPYREHALAYPQPQFYDSYGLDDFTSTTIFGKCYVITSSGVQELYILITHLELPYPKLLYPMLKDESCICKNLLTALWKVLEWMVRKKTIARCFGYISDESV